MTSKHQPLVFQTLGGEKYVIYEDNVGKRHSVSHNKVKNYQGSVLETLLKKHLDNGDLSPVGVKIGYNDMVNIVYYYTNGIWKNPYIYGNGLKLDSFDTFEQKCAVLGLSDNYEEVQNDSDIPDDYFHDSDDGSEYELFDTDSDNDNKEELSYFDMCLLEHNGCDHCDGHGSDCVNFY